MNLSAHGDFIIAAYAAAAIILSLLTGWIVLDYRLLRRRLSSLEAEGVMRRSDAAGQASP